MTASGIVPAFDEVEDREARVGLRAEVLPIEQLALEGREEALAERVVVRVADRTHGRPDAGRATPLAEGHRGVLGGFNRSTQHSLCERIVGPHRAPRLVFASRGSCVAWC